VILLKSVHEHHLTRYSCRHEYFHAMDLPFGTEVFCEGCNEDVLDSFYICTLCEWAVCPNCALHFRLDEANSEKEERRSKPDTAAPSAGAPTRGASDEPSTKDDRHEHMPESTSAPSEERGRANPPIDPPAEYVADAEAVRLKARANIQYGNGNFDEAIELYTAALRLDEKWATLYHNRAAANMALGYNSMALADAQAAIECDGSEPKFHVRASKCYLRLGKISEAEVACKGALRIDETYLAAREMRDQCKTVRQAIETARKALDGERFAQSLATIDSVWRDCPCVEAGVIKVRCYLGQFNTINVRRTLSDLCSAFKNHSELQYLSALAMLQRGDSIKSAHACLVKAENAPERCAQVVTALDLISRLSFIKGEGNTAYKKGDFDKAVELYTKAIEIDPHDSLYFHAVLLTNRAVARGKLGKNDLAISDCALAISRNPIYSKARMKRAELFTVQKDLEEAIADYEWVLANDPSHDMKVPDHIRATKGQLAAQQREESKRSHYDVLGVSANVDQAAIKKAYKKKAMKLHPDRVTEPHLKRRHEKEFKRLNEAQRILTDPEERRKYDRKRAGGGSSYGFPSRGGYGFRGQDDFYEDEEDDDDYYDDDDDEGDEPWQYYDEFVRDMFNAASRRRICRACGLRYAQPDCGAGQCGVCCRH